MSLPHPNDAPSPEPAEGVNADVAALTRERGAPLLEGLEERIPGSREHADGTASWALAIAVELGLEPERCLAVREAARLHEIGNLYTDAELLAKLPDQLSDDDARRVEAHAEAGGRLAEGAGVPSAPCIWIRHSRERFDGSGVPDGLYGGAIPIESRIIRAACAFETSLHRIEHAPERPKRPSSTALAELQAAAGTELDPATVEALVRILARASGS